jgi:hypothetical protein
VLIHVFTGKDMPKNMNELTVRIHSKGYKLEEFLQMINRSNDWYYKHSNGGKMYNFLVMAIEGLEKKSDL